MTKIKFTVHTDGDSFKGFVDQQKLAFKGTSHDGTSEKDLPAGKHEFIVATIGLPGQSFRGDIDGANPPAPPVTGKIADDGHGAAGTDFDVPPSGGGFGLAASKAKKAAKKAAKKTTKPHAGKAAKKTTKKTAKKAAKKTKSRRRGGRK